MPDPDDVFRDFEGKVKDKKEKKIGFKAFKRSTDNDEELSKEELQKRKMAERKKTLEEKYRKEQLALEHRFKSMKQDLETEEKAIKEGIPHTPKKQIFYERIGYWAVIALLILYIIIDVSVFHGEDDVQVRELTENEQDAALQETVASESEEPEAETESEVQEEPEPEPEEEPEEKKETKTYSNKVLFTIDEVETEKKDDNIGTISEVSFTIVNDRSKILHPVVHVFAWDDQDSKFWQTKSRGIYTSSISPGGKITGKIELSPKTFNDLHLKKNIKLTLNDTTDGFITDTGQFVEID